MSCLTACSCSLKQSDAHDTHLKTTCERGSEPDKGLSHKHGQKIHCCGMKRFSLVAVLLKQNQAPKPWSHSSPSPGVRPQCLPPQARHPHSFTMRHPICSLPTLPFPSLVDYFSILYVSQLTKALLPSLSLAHPIWSALYSPSAAWKCMGARDGVGRTERKCPQKPQSRSGEAFPW